VEALLAAAAGFVLCHAASINKGRAREAQYALGAPNFFLDRGQQI
jgi:hypothetical protein